MCACACVYCAPKFQTDWKIVTHIIIAIFNVNDAHISNFIVFKGEGNIFRETEEFISKLKNGLLHYYCVIENWFNSSSHQM